MIDSNSAGFPPFVTFPTARRGARGTSWFGRNGGVQGETRREKAPRAQAAHLRPCRQSGTPRRGRGAPRANPQKLLPGPRTGGAPRRYGRGAGAAVLGQVQRRWLRRCACRGRGAARCAAQRGAAGRAHHRVALRAPRCAGHRAPGGVRLPPPPAPPTTTAVALAGVLCKVHANGGRDDVRAFLRTVKSQLVPPTARRAPAFALLLALAAAAERLRQFSPVKGHDKLGGVVLEELRMRLFRVVTGDTFAGDTLARRAALDCCFLCKVRARAYVAAGRRKAEQARNAPGPAAPRAAARGGRASLAPRHALVQALQATPFKVLPDRRSPHPNRSKRRRHASAAPSGALPQRWPWLRSRPAAPAVDAQARTAQAALAPP